MDAVAGSSSHDDRLYANGARKIHPKRNMPKASSLPIVQAFGSSEEPHYATPPVEQPRENRGKELRLAWAVLIIQILLSSALLILGAYHVIEAHRDVEDAPNTFLSEPVAAAPAAAVSLYYEAVSILQLGLITLFTGALGCAAYFPHGVRQPAKMVFLLFVSISIHIALSQMASISEEIAHKTNIEVTNATYRIAELCLLPLIVLCFMVASYPACAAFVLYKFDKQTSRFLRILYLIVNVAAIFVFLAHVLACAAAIYGGYNGMHVALFTATVRLSFGVCALPASFFGLFVLFGSMKPIFSGSRPVGVWAAVLGAGATLVMYNGTPLLAGLFQDSKGDSFDSAYIIQYALHCSAILAWTAVILLGAAFAYVR